MKKIIPIIGLLVTLESISINAQVYTKEMTVEETSSGKVEIGSATENADLLVNGQATTNGNLTINGGTTANGNIAVNGDLQIDGQTILRDPQVVGQNISYSSDQWVNLYNGFQIGSYLCRIDGFHTSGKGGNIYHFQTTFLLTWYYGTNGPDAFYIPNSQAALAMNGSSVNLRVQNSWGNNVPNLQMQVNGENANGVTFNLHFVRIF